MISSERSLTDNNQVTAQQHTSGRGENLISSIVPYYHLLRSFSVTQQPISGIEEETGDGAHTGETKSWVEMVHEEAATQNLLAGNFYSCIVNV